MSHPDSAPCPKSFKPGEGGPSSFVVVRILSVKPNTDLEGDDDYVPFYDNHADIYGHVTIDGQSFELPQIEESDFPHWDTNGIFQKQVSSSPVPIRIDIWEGDSGLTGDDDHVDINPQGGKRELDFMFDLCSLMLSGDINGPAQGVHKISGGSGDEAATIAFTIGLADGRPVSQNDLALVDLDLIQVVPGCTRMVARKGTVVLVRIANNHPVTVNTTLRLRISGGGFTADETFPLTIESGAVMKRYFFDDHPLMFPAAQAAYPLAVIADIVDPNAGTLQPGDCRLSNDHITKRTTWKVVTTDPQFSLLWAKVGTLLDVGNYVPDSQFDELVELGTGYIRAVYPLIGPSSSSISASIPPPPVTAASDWLVSVLSAFQLPADAVEPIVLTFELNAVAALLPCSRFMGVLPNKDWFARFSGWSDITGFSLGEFASRAVIFLPQLDNGSEVGPQVTLPAHEMGHTFGLSVDSRLKQSWVCDIDWPIVGHAPCGLVGGFDEYKHTDPALQDGNPSNGYWVRRGSEPAALAGLANAEQCDSHCFMGGSPVNPQDDWPNRGRWIDAADYDQLIDKLMIHPDPEVVFVSGMISWNNQLYLGRCFRLDAGVPDLTRRTGMYGFRFVDRSRCTLSEIALPAAWNHAEFHRPLPVTFFGVTLALPERATHLEIWNRGTATLLGTIDLDRGVPEVRLDEPTVHQDSAVTLCWRGTDRENAPLRYAVLLSTDGEQWWPAGYELAESELVLAKGTLPRGEYQAEVLALNSVRVGRSNRVRFSV